jgi:UDP-N-acetylglucosamine 4,6-dehydratase
MKPVDCKAITVVGGTGTLGSELVKTITQEFPWVKLTIVSRDEHKQAALRSKFPKAHFGIGDVKEYDSISQFIYGRDIVFHVAAMKRVETCEANPVEAMKINFQGTANVARACLNGHVKHMIFSSTDKAVEPITHYGFTKAAAETILYNYNRSQSQTKFAVYRWGNVLGSNGSVIPQFIKSLTEDKKITLTHPDMTRFWLPIDWPVQYMLHTFGDAHRDRAMVPPVMKAASVLEVASALAELLGVTYTVEQTGIRGKEKLHELMYESNSEYFLRSDTCEKYSKDELKELLLPYLERQAS